MDYDQFFVYISGGYLEPGNFNECCFDASSSLSAQNDASLLTFNTKCG